MVSHRTSSVRWPKGRNTLSSANDLASVPPGQHLFIDANIFIYHFTQSPLTAVCTAFLQRVEAGEILGSTSVVTLTEVAHRLMLLEAIRTFGLAPRTAVKYLKEHPPLVTQLTQYRIATAAIAAFNVTVVPVTPEHLPIAQQHCAQHGLLTNDALMIAVMHTLGLADVASNDPDLMRIPGLTIWQPQPQRGSITNTLTGCKFCQSVQPIVVFEDNGFRRRSQSSSNGAIQPCLSWHKSPQPRRFPSNSLTPSFSNLSCRTSPCLSADPSANWAIIASSTSSYGSCTPECNGNACRYRTTPMESRPSTTRPSTKSSPGGPMMAHLSTPSSPVWGIWRTRITLISACCMAMGRTRWPKKGVMGLAIQATNTRRAKKSWPS